MKLTPEQYELLPTDEDVEFYRQHGYYVSKRIFSDDEIDEAIYGSERFYSGERDFSLPHSVRPFEGWKPESGDGIRINDYVSLQNAEILSLMLNPLLGAIAARLSGSSTIRLWHDQMIFKPTDAAGNKTSIGWHTDRAYWKTCSSANMLTAWIPFQTCDESMGPLMVVDESHRLRGNSDLRYFHTNDQTGLQDRFTAGDRRVVKIPLKLEKGQVSFHHCLTIHGSGPNMNSTPRHSISVHLQDDSNRYQAYTHPNGERAWHRNDVLCRTINGLPDYTDPDFCPVLWSGGEGGAV
jgi:ectoine hydroxylase-related dioxygenase (phytanoyl-CoA dioxygenase family)